MIDVPQPVVSDFQIDPGGRDVGMTEQPLDADQINAPFEQAGGEIMTQGMGAEF
jgi:hypothetical protein